MPRRTLWTVFSLGLALNSLSSVLSDNASHVAKSIDFAHNAPITLMSLIQTKFGTEKPYTCRGIGADCHDGTCCRGSEHCCPDGCCPSSAKCFGVDHCCPNNAQTCGGKLCCIPSAVCCGAVDGGCCEAGSTCCKLGCCGPGEKCCGDGCCDNDETCCGDKCCASGDSCVQDQCISSVIVSRQLTFKYDADRNGELLRNYCLQTGNLNLIILEFDLLGAEDQRRTRMSGAGCNSSRCRQQGLSCNEFPPAGMENGAIPRQSCIPPYQNAYQGQALNRLIRDLKLAVGQQFLFTLSCNTLGPHNKRDSTSSGATNATLLYPPSLTHTGDTSYFIIPLGDLGPGNYDILAQVNQGSTLGGFVSDNLGNNLTTNDTAMKPNGSQHYTFTISDQGELMGVGLMLATKDSKTNVTWTITTQALPSQTATGGNVPTSTSVGGDDNGQSLGSAIQNGPGGLIAGMVLLCALGAGL